MQIRCNISPPFKIFNLEADTLIKYRLFWLKK
uniref:Uncharacterized protein n=1 Tax=Firmicutes phage HS19 TaxID=3056397 RepID=A0AA49X4U8_9VIRU|nr:MAG: hypothetical protein [Firmicutes phage HS19]